MKKKKLALLLLIIASILFALAPAILKLLQQRGGIFGISHPNAISFCNVLFIGNLCAGLVALFYYGPPTLMRELLRLPKKAYIYLTLAAILTTIYPSLIFLALERTTVINIVLLSRFNGIVYIILAFLILGLRLHWSEILGYTIMAIAVIVLVLSNSNGYHISTGDILILSATVFFSLTEIVSKKLLPICSIPLYIFIRNFVSSILFFIIATYLFSIRHFAQLLFPDIWVLMVIYAVFAIVLAQLLWLSSIKTVPIPIVANIKLFDPVFSLGFAYLLLSEIPSLEEWIVIAVIIIGIAIPKFFMRKMKPEMVQTVSLDTSFVGK